MPRQSHEENLHAKIAQKEADVPFQWVPFEALENKRTGALTPETYTLEAAERVAPRCILVRNVRGSLKNYIINIIVKRICNIINVLISICSNNKCSHHFYCFHRLILFCFSEPRGHEMYNNFKKSWRLLSASLILTAPALFATHALPPLSKKGERASVFRIAADEALQLLPAGDGAPAISEQERQEAEAAFQEAQDKYEETAAHLREALEQNTDFQALRKNAQQEEKKASKSVRRLQQEVERNRGALHEELAYYAAAQDGFIKVAQAVKKTPQAAQTAQAVGQPLVTQALEVMKEEPDSVFVDDLSASFDDNESTLVLGQESFESMASYPASSSSSSSSRTPSRMAERLRGAVKAAPVSEEEPAARRQIEELRELVIQAHALEMDNASLDVNTVGARLDALETDLAVAQKRHAAAEQALRQVDQEEERVKDLAEAADHAFERAAELGQDYVWVKEGFLQGKDGKPTEPFEIYTDEHPTTR